MNYEIIRIDEQTWRIEENGVRFFLLAGTKKALLIDSGMTVKNAREIAEGLTSLPVELLNTHADRDHIAGNEAFDFVYMNPAELVNYRAAKRTGDIRPVFDGDILDLGERPLEIITLPGHTPGSIAVLDVNRKVLISGDPIQDGRIFMFGPMRNIPAYYHSLKKLNRYQGRFDAIYPSHAGFPVAPSLIGDLIHGVERLERGEIVPTKANLHGTPIKRYDIGAAVLLCDADADYEG